MKIRWMEGLCPFATLAATLCASCLTTCAKSSPTDHEQDSATDGSPHNAPLLHDGSKILFIGNSYLQYSGGVDEVLSGLVKAASPSLDIETELVIKSGAELQQHWENGDARTRISDGDWDVVVLQNGAGYPPSDFTSFNDYSRRFDDVIHKAGASACFFAHWTWRFRLVDVNANDQDRLNAAYEAIAEELEACLLPVGEAFQRSYKERPDLNLYAGDDALHPGPHGTYLAAAVAYAVLLGKSPVGNPFIHHTAVSESDAAFLQRIAWEAVESVAAAVQTTRK